MATQILKTLFQFKRGLSEAWERTNPVLAEGEPGWEIDTCVFKVGDGVTPWNDLALRFQHKHDIEANWINNSDFIPKNGEIVIYDTDEDNIYPRLKIGDGILAINDLPFVGDDILEQLAKTQTEIEGKIELTKEEILEEVEIIDEEIDNASVSFDGIRYDSLGDAIRAQGTKISIKHSVAEGRNTLKQDAWKALPEGEITLDDEGIITVSHNEFYGEQLEQIKESDIEPHVGHYLYKNFDELLDEDPGEAAYLTNAEVASRSFVKGASVTKCDFSIMTPAAILELNRPARFGRVDIICRDLDGIPTEFDIQVKTLSGEWVTVKSGKPEDNLFNDKQLYQNFTFDPVLGTAVRVLFFDCRGDFPKLLEITLHEVKTERLLERIIPDSYATDVVLLAPDGRTAGDLATTQDGDRYGSYCQTFSFTKPVESSDDNSSTTISPSTADLIQIDGIPAPVIGHYANNNTDSDIIAYNHGTHIPGNAVNGNLTDQARFDYFTHAEIASGTKIPVMFFALEEEKALGAIEVYGYQAYRYNMENFDVQVLTKKGWKTVASAENAFHVEGAEFGDDLIGDDQSLKLYFDDIYTTDTVRILVSKISDMSPDGVEDEEMRVGGSIRVAEVKLYEAVPQKEKDDPIPFEFRFNEEVTISKFKIFAYKKNNYTPKSIFLTAEIDGEWVGIFGTDKYNDVEIYPEGFTDTFVGNLDKDYRVTAIRLHVTDRVGLNDDGSPKEGQLILNEIEFYGPAKCVAKETSIGITYDEYDMSFAQKAEDVWYFGAKVCGEKFESNNTSRRPNVVLEADVNGQHKELVASMLASESLDDYYCAFTIPENYPGLFTNLSVKVQYPDTDSVQNKVCKFSDFTLVNLTEAYGKGEEPSADEYYKALRTSVLTVNSQEGTSEFSSIAGPRGATGKTAYEYALEEGYTGTEEEFAQKMNASNTEVYPAHKGSSILDDNEMRSLPRSEIVGEQDGIVSVVNSPYHGDYLEAIKESKITPQIGFDCGEIFVPHSNPIEATYLTDALYGTTADIGVEGIPYEELWVDNERYVHFNKNVTPTVILDLSEPTVIGAVELNCRPKYRAPAQFRIEVKNLAGEWVKVFETLESNYETFAIDGTTRFEFTPVEGTSVRVLIHVCYYDNESDDNNQYPQLLEIVVYERKTGRILEKVEPTYIETEAHCDSGTEISIIDGNRNTNFQSLHYSEVGEDGKSHPLPFTFHFYDKPTISRVKIFAYHNQKHTPAKIILEAQVDGEWISLYDINGNFLGSSTTPSIGSDGKERAYTNTVLYTTDLKDTAVIDLDKEYEVSAMRLYVTSVLGGVAPLILSDVEFYGPQKADAEYSNKLGLVYHDRMPVKIEEPDRYYWYFGAKVACEGINRGDQLSDTWNPPQVILEWTENDDEARQLDLGEISGDKVFEEFCVRFRTRENTDRISNIKLYVKYLGHTSNIPELTCKFTDVSLVNLSEAYGEDMEPTAEEYAKLKNMALMTIQTTEGVKKYILGHEEEPPVKSVNGKTGSVALYASDVGAAPSGYGWGESMSVSAPNRNLNDVERNGLYDAGTSISNSPSNCRVVFHCAYISSLAYQLGFCTDGRLAIRVKDGSWSTWSYFYPGSEVTQDLNSNGLDYCFTNGIYRIAQSTPGNPRPNAAYEIRCTVVMVMTGSHGCTQQIALCEDGAMAVRSYYEMRDQFNDRLGYTWTPWKWVNFDPSLYDVTTGSALTENQKLTARQNIGAINSDEVNALLDQVRDYIYMRDSETGETYKVYIQNGQLSMALVN